MFTCCMINTLKNINYNVRETMYDNHIAGAYDQGSVLGCPKPVLGRTVPQTSFKPAFYCPKLSKSAQNCLKLSTEYQSAKLTLA